MNIELEKLEYNFRYKPLLIGGKAMEYYGLRKAGTDIDLVIHRDDHSLLVAKYPYHIKDLYGDIGVCVFGFEIWNQICTFDYNYLKADAIEEDNFLVVSLEKLLFLKALAMEISKYHKDLELVVKKVLDKAYENYNYTPYNNSFKRLWYSGSEIEWNKALNHYYDALRDNQKELECYIENIDADEIEGLSVNDFYNFLYDKYFVWKYTQKNRLGSTRKELRRYIDNNELTKLESIHNRLFSVQKDNIGECLGIATEIYGLGTAGASGLLSVLFPEYFGTLDQFVVKRLREIEHTTYHHKLEKMNPERLSNKDGVILIEIMREKAEELNRRFNTDFWTPRKIDMILWSFGR